MVEEFMVLLVWFLCNQDPQTIHRPINPEGSHAIRSGPLAPVHCRGPLGERGGVPTPGGGGEAGTRQKLVSKGADRGLSLLILKRGAAPRKQGQCAALAFQNIKCILVHCTMYIVHIYTLHRGKILVLSARTKCRRRFPCTSD